MTLQTTGPMSFGDINVELGLSRTAQLSIGGAAARALAGVASGAIRTAADFYGKSSVVISIANDTITADAVYESDFDFNSTTYGIYSNGLIAAFATSTNGGANDGLTNGTNWVTPTSSASLYEVRATKVSGDAFQPTGSALGVWLPCTSNREWQLMLSGAGRFDCVLTIEIRDAATQTVRDTATITMMAKNQN